MERQTIKTNARPPLQWTGIIFAFASNLLLVTVAQTTAQWAPGVAPTLLLLLLGALLAGILTTLYIRERGAMHAFIGGMLSMPVLAVSVLGGLWQIALLAGALCGLGGSVAEIVMRRRITR